MINVYSAYPVMDGINYSWVLKGHDVIIRQLKNYIKFHYDNVVFHGGNLPIEWFDISGRSTQINDCELLVDFDGTYHGVSFIDLHSDMVYLLTHRNTEGDVLAMTQLKNTASAYTHISNPSDYKCKFKESIQVTQWGWLDYTIYRSFRQHLTEFKDKFFFFGNVSQKIGAGFRDTPLYLQGSEYFDGSPAIAGWNAPEYMDRIIHYKVGLAISGIGEFCYRDVEFMAVGIPFIKMEYVSNLNPPLIPNYHYISVPRLDQIPTVNERVGGPEYADAYLQRFMEVKDDTEFLNFISKNSMEYYDKYLHPSVRLEHLISIMELPPPEK
jgi:hypothetical protein